MYCIGCEWCYNWEHKYCIGLSNDKVLDDASANVILICTKRKPKVKLALKFFADIQQKQRMQWSRKEMSLYLQTN